MAAKLFESIDLLTTACRVLRKKCVCGITANADTCREQVMQSIGTVTALVPHLGYERSSEIAKEALSRGVSVADLVLEHELMDEETLSDILDPAHMLAPNVSGSETN